MSDWIDLKTCQPADGSYIALKFSGGDETTATWPPATMSKEDQVAEAKAGNWPDYKRWTPTHWKPIKEDKT